MTVAVQQPDISYHPDFEKYKLRTERLKSQREPHISLPAGFPQHLTGQLVWEGKDFTDDKDWTFALNEEQLAEIDAALQHFKSLNKPLGAISQKTFPLPILQPLLRREAKELQNGRGFFVLRGLQVDKYSIEDNIVIYTGVSSYIASRRGRQDNKIINGEKKSNMLNHIKDLSQTAQAGNIGAPAYTTDNPAAEGGESKLASSWRIYNELARTRPDLIRTLASDWVFDGYGDKAKPYTRKPLLFHTPASGTSSERVVIQYARRGFTGFLNLPRTPCIPPITEPQAEALDTLHFLAEKFSLTLDFHKGDVQYVNNLSIFHARDGFKDTVDKRRHLLRLWLRDELAWETPAQLRERWDELYKDVTEEEQVFTLTPQIRGGAGKPLQST